MTVGLMAAISLTYLAFWVWAEALVRKENSITRFEIEQQRLLNEMNTKFQEDTEKWFQ